MNIDKEKIPKDVKWIVDTLIKKGYQAYLVGGAVRDLLMDQSPVDYDIATSALPENVEAIFEKTIPTGKRFGTITVILNEKSYEVTTFRKETAYDGRRPQQVDFSNALKEDLARRDFTINAMAIDQSGKVIDYFGGLEDLKNKQLHFVGNPDERIAEDRLRVLRYIRFSRRLNCKTTQQLPPDVDISILSSERVREEFNGILLTDMPSKGIRMLEDLGLLNQILPEIMPSIGFEQHSPFHFLTVYDHTLCALDQTKDKLEVRLAVLLHDIGKPSTFQMDASGIGHFYKHHRASELLAKDFLIRMKYSKKTTTHVLKLIHHHMLYFQDLKTSSCKRLLHKLGEEVLWDLIDLMLADRKATNHAEDIEDILLLKNMCEKVINESPPFALKDLKVNGYDMISLGYVGPDIGAILTKLFHEVMEETLENEKDVLIEYAKKMRTSE